MNQVEIKRHKLIKFIKSTNPFYAFSNFEGHTMKQLEKIKNDIERVIRSTAEKNKQERYKS